MKKLLIGVGALVLVVALVGLWALLRMNAFNHVDPVMAGTCHRIDGMPGAEDLTIDQNTGIAYISSLDRRAPGKPGTIFGLDLTAPAPRPVNLTPYAEADFQPHGLSLWSTPGGPGRLMVISHPPRNGRIEHEVIVYEALGLALRKVKTVVDPTPEAPQYLVNPNDLVAISPGAFYATNDHAAQDNNSKVLEDLFSQEKSTVVFYDGLDFSVAAYGLNFANGINVSADGSQVYVTSTIDDVLYVHDRNTLTGGLSETAAIDMGGGADNIERLPDGSLLVGVHPNLLTLLRSAADPDKPAPSWILHVAWDSDQPTVETLHASDGSDIPGASVAAQYGDRMLIGSIYASYILDCTIED